MSGQVAVRFEPPRGMSPALAGVLLDGSVGAREIGVMIVDLAVRGWFVMEEETDGRWGLRSAARLPPRGEQPTPAEVRLMDVLFRPSLVTQEGDDCPAQYVSLTTIRHRLQGHVEEIGQLLGEAIVAAGLMTKNPVKRGLGRRASLTPEGARVAEELKGYRLYLERAEAGPLQASSLEQQFRAELGYATALGVVDAWVDRIRAAAPDELSAVAKRLGTDPRLFGTASGVSGGYNLETLFDLKLAEHYGARFR